VVLADHPPGQVMDISLKRVEIDRRGKDGLICADNIRAGHQGHVLFVRVEQDHRARAAGGADHRL